MSGLEGKSRVQLKVNHPTLGNLSVQGSFYRPTADLEKLYNSAANRTFLYEGRVYNVKYIKKPRFEWIGWVVVIF